MVAASLFVTDAAQSIAAGGLRGQGHSGAASVRRHCLLVNRLLTWLCAGLKIGLGATGIWIGLSIGTNIDGGLLVLVSSCWRAGVLSEPSLDCVMAVLGVRESRHARRLRGSLRLKEGKASDWKPDSRPRSHQQFRAFCKGASNPIYRPSLTSISSLATTLP